MLRKRIKRRKNNIILCELYNEKIHGHCEDNGEIINAHYFVIQKIKNIFRQDNYNNDDDMQSLSSTDTDDIDNDDINNSNYSVKVKELIQLHMRKYVLLRLNSYLMAHPTIRNFRQIVTRANYIKPEIAECYLKKGILVAILKTFWLKIIQRKWKKICEERQSVLQKRKSIYNIRYREIHGKWNISCCYLPSIVGMLSDLAT
jgi:hypothetical protein